MKKRQILIASTFLAMVFQVHGIAQQDIAQLKTVQKVKASGKIKLEIIFKDDFSLDIKSPDLTLDCFTHNVVDGELLLKIKTSLDCKGEVKAILTIPKLKEINLSGGVVLNTNNMMKADSLVIIQQLGSKAYLDVDVDYLEVKLLEGSYLEIGGNADKQLAVINSKANYSARNLKTEKADISANFLSTAKVCATDHLKANSGANAVIIPISL